jgi:hypothetical protein
MEYKVIITKSEYIINGWLDKGWVIESVSPQRVSTGGGLLLYGEFCFVIKRDGTVSH